MSAQLTAQQLAYLAPLDAPGGLLCSGGPALGPGEGSATMLAQIAAALAYWQALLTSQQLAVPANPVPSNATTGGTVAAGTYQCWVSYVDPYGESPCAAAGATTTTTATSTLTVPSPSANANAIGWYAYVSQVGGTAASATRQQAAGNPTAVGSNFILTAPPTSTGVVVPAANSSGFFGGCTASAIVDAVAWLTKLQSFYQGTGAFPGVR